MPTFNIAFTAPTFLVSTTDDIMLGLRIEHGGVIFTGVNHMAFQTTADGGRFRTTVVGFDRRGNEVPLPPDFPTVDWTGFNDAVAEHVVAANTQSVDQNPLAQGQYTVTATAAGFMPATEDVTITPAPVATIGLRTANV